MDGQPATGVVGNGDTAMKALQLEPLTPMKNIVEEGEAEFIQSLPLERIILARREEPQKRSALIHTSPIKSPFVKVIAIGPGCVTDLAVGDRVTYSQVMALPDEMTKGGVAWALNYVWIHEAKILARLPRNADDKGVTLRPVQGAGSSVRHGEMDEETIGLIYEAKRVWKDLGQKLGFDADDPNFVLQGPQPGMGIGGAKK